MDGPQHYQSLSYALQPPTTTSSRPLNNIYAQPANNDHQQQSNYIQPQKQRTNQPSTVHQEEEEEEEDDDDDDEGLVEEQLNRSNDVDMHGSNPSSPKPTSNVVPQQHSNNRMQDEQASPTPEQKRRPGRPRGSKNRRPRIGPGKQENQNQFYYQTPNPTVTTIPAGPIQTTVAASTTSASAPPQHPNITSHNQQYYEFQWRVLNLCAEFYGAAEELVKGTPPLVVAQCYHMGPGVKLDPLVMLGEAKRICDNLLANPSQLVTNPPPSLYPTLPTPTYQPPVATPAPAATPPVAPAPQVTPVTSTSAAASAPSTSAPPNPPVITNAQTFVVPLNTQPAQYAAYPTMYGAPPGPYPTASYYQYAGYPPPGTYYAQPMATHPITATPTVATPLTGSTMSTVQTQPTATITTTPATGGTVIGNQGAWSDEETERLKKLAEDSRVRGPSAEIDWDWVIQEWGISRTRHQILIKATAMGLKESSTRVSKRRRETEPDPPAMASLQQQQQQQQTSATTSNLTSNPPAMTMPSTSSPAHSVSQSGSTPSASPALQHQQRPSSSKGPSSLSAATATVTASQAQQPTKHQWTMPTMPVNSVNTALTMPIMNNPVPSNPHDQQKVSSYYRPRPNQGGEVTHQQKVTPQPPLTHQFSMYAPLRKENGK